MKNALKWVGIILCSMIGLIVLSAAGLFIYGQISFKTTNTDRPLYPIEADTSQDGIERGKYLMETATGCTDGCHTSAGNDTPLSGNSVEISEGSISFTFAVPNLTPDAETGLGNWKDAEIARAIREGVDKDGVSLVVMPFNNYRVLSDSDVAAIVAYLRNLEPVHNEIPPFQGNAVAKTMNTLVKFRPSQVGEPDDLRIYGRSLSKTEILALFEGEPRGEISVSIASPAGGETVNGTIAVEVSATADVGVSWVELFKNGEFFVKDALPPYTFIWSTALDPNGSYSLTAVAVDSSGNSASSQTVRTTVSNPSVNFKPNIVVMVTDDQRWDTMQYMPEMQSRLYPESIRFSNAFAAVPLCCPSRATIFSGLYSHNHGVLDNKPPYGAPAFDHSSTIATWLQGVGYRTGLFGKYMNEYDDIAPFVPPGWDQFSAFLTNNGNYYDYTLVENGTSVQYLGPENYSTDVLAAKAMEFINTADPAEPVFVYLAFFAPHFNLEGGEMSSPPVPAPAYDGAYAGLAPWRPASYNEADVSDKPLWVRKLPVMDTTTIATGDLFRIKQLESLLAVDRAVGDLIDTLIAAGRYENTVFVFLSDNGLSWGEHRWNWKKWCSYEECIRIPFWIHVPGMTGRDEGALVNDVDLAPTLAELAGALPASEVDGLSLVDLIENPVAPWRTEAYTEYLGLFQPTGVKIVFREVRTASYMYAEYETGDREFYDLSVDPLEELNRINDPGYTQTVSDLQKVLEIYLDDE